MVEIFPNKRAILNLHKCDLLSPPTNLICSQLTTELLTSRSVCSIVHSNVYGLVNIHCIRYHTVVDSFHSTLPPLQKYHTLTSSSMKVPLYTTARNSSSIGEEPVPPGINNGKSATSSQVSYTQQGIITFTNVLQEHNTIVLVVCTSEYEPHTWEGRCQLF